MIRTLALGAALALLIGIAQAAEELTESQMDVVTAAGTWQAFDFNDFMAAYTFSSGDIGSVKIDLSPFRAQATSFAQSFHGQAYSQSLINTPPLRR